MHGNPYNASSIYSGGRSQPAQLSPKQKLLNSLQKLIENMIQNKDEKHVREVINFYQTQIEWQKLIEDTLMNVVKEKRFPLLLHWLCSLNESILFHKLWKKDVIKYGIKDGFGHVELCYAVGSNAENIIKSILERDIAYVKEKKITVHDLELYATRNGDKPPLKLAFEKINLNIFNLLKGYETRFLFDTHRSFISIPRITGDQNTFTGTQQTFQMDWKDVINADPDYHWLPHPTGQLVYIDQVGTHMGMCLGFNIGNNYFLTAGHCLLNQSLQIVCTKLISISMHSYRVSFNYQYNNKITPDEKYRTIQENLYAITEVADWGKCHGIDYAVFKLEPSAEALFGRVRLDAHVPAQYGDIALAHHPRGLPKKLSLGHVSETITDTDFELKHTAHTLGGSSGSPIADVKTGKVVAVHVRGVEETQAVHIGLLVREIAKFSKEVDAIGKFGLFKKQNKSRGLPTSTPGKSSPQIQGYF